MIHDWSGKTTLDGVAVYEGLIVWDNNLDLARVSKVTGVYPGAMGDVTWWRMVNPLTGKESPMQDGTRMAVRAYGLPTARAALIDAYLERFPTVFDSGVPWESDPEIECGGCGAQWDYNMLDHDDECPYIEAADRHP